VCDCETNKSGYHESTRRELKIKPNFECRYDEILKTNVEESTHLSRTGLVGELEHLKMKTRLIDEKFTSPMGEGECDLEVMGAPSVLSIICETTCAPSIFKLTRKKAAALARVLREEGKKKAFRLLGCLKKNSRDSARHRRENVLRRKDGAAC
jgi:hypothetical protein